MNYTTQNRTARALDHTREWPDVAALVASRHRHQAAVEEACRRLRVMAEKWPDKPWRMVILAHPRHGRYGRRGWSIVATLDSPA